MLRETAFEDFQSTQAYFLGYYKGCERRHTKNDFTIHSIYNLTLLI